MSEKKHDLMYQYFGKDYNHFCSECRNLIRVNTGNRTCYKCTVYGNTGSEASDWKRGQTACGQFNKDWKMPPLIKCSAPKKEDKAEVIEPLEGQLGLW